MTETLLDYIKTLATEHVDFLHDDNGRIAYYEFHWEGFMSVKNRNTYIIFVNGVNGRYGTTQGEYRYDDMQVELIFLGKVPATAMRKSRNYLIQSKAYAEQFVARMREDRTDPDLCGILRTIDFNNIEYESTPLSADGWIGVQVTLPIRADMTTEYDAAKWATP